MEANLWKGEQWHVLSPNHCSATFFVVGLDHIEKKWYSDLKCMANECLNEKTDFEQICVDSRPICPVLFKAVERTKLH